MYSKHQGFTLIELMIAVAVVGILAAIAYPSYRNQIMRSNRAEAKAVLLQVQTAQEKFFLQNNRYAGAATAAASITELNNSPTDTTPGLGIASTTTKGYYAITLVRPTSTTYTATATTAGSQTSDTTCATFTINETGSRTPTTGGCW